ncbi:Hypothetical predicted protein [Paramuricea clavata]|uniref:Uncharacterized protein n=1 Tax=Paramuricea clavata TaxID=317549 RepID=A0A6S7GFQ0_PARCT|nr:Hypothetical predicted protein [Paramuricea clavata]
MKKGGSITYGGQRIADLEDTLLDATGDEASEDAYAQLIIKLNKHFLAKTNKDFAHARFQFGNLTQNHDESLVRYYTRIREIAKKCSFSNESEAIRDHLIKTMTNNVVRIKAIRKNWTLDQILEEAELDEETRTQAKEMEKKVNSDETIKRVINYRQQRQRPSSQIFREQSTSSTREKTTNPCNRCGYDRAHKQCPAMGSLCNACGKRNHYAKIHRTTGDETTLSCVVYINGHKTLVEPDTGADSNIMDEIQLQELKTKSPEIRLPVKGECIVNIENETRITQAPLVIIKGKINSLPLLGRTTLEELG